MFWLPLRKSSVLCNVIRKTFRKRCFRPSIYFMRHDSLGRLGSQPKWPHTDGAHAGESGVTVAEQEDDNTTRKPTPWREGSSARQVPSDNVPCPGISLVVQRLRFHAPKAGGLGLIPGRGTQFHMPQLSVCMPQLKIQHATVKREDPACGN